MTGMKRFEIYLQQIEKLLTEAVLQEDPGLWLYKNNFRTPLFMLEALSKMYAAFYNKKKFTRLEERFKLLEDILGGADYYDSFAKEFIADKTIPGSVIAWLQARAREKIILLNKTLDEKNWLKENKRIAKIRKRLARVDWKNEKEETNWLPEYYHSEIDKILGFVNKENFHFENVEADVHELRRKLRWLSIYPQALQGRVQLVKSGEATTQLTKYLTPEIVNSPFNKMPEPGDNKYILLLEQDHFLALSWMIAELGKIKDKGLRVIALKDALQQSENMIEPAAFIKAYELLGSEQPQIQQLLSEAEGICQTYFSEKNLEHLVMGVAEAKDFQKGR